MRAESTDAPVGPAKNLGWTVTFAGLGINLALGILYTWSVIGKKVPAEWGWSETGRSIPYAIACLVFSIVMVPAGKMQDRIGPRITASIGGLLVGAGMIVASFTDSVLGYAIGIGVLAGAGIGFGYASATPAAVKWFPKAKTGLIAGLVVSGFGLASVYGAPVAKILIDSRGMSFTMMTLGIVFMVVVVGLAQLLCVPHKVRQALEGLGPNTLNAEATTKKDNFTPGEMLSTWQFYALWFMYTCGAGAGLMIIGKLATIASIQAKIEIGFVLVAALAVGNGGGRILAGILSDKLGRTATMFGSFVMQAVLIFLLSKTQEGSFLANVGVLAALSALIGASYGANLTLFPSITKDFYGLKNFGMNYGLVFTAWGVGGFSLALVAGEVYKRTESFNFAYYTASALLIVAALMTFVVRPPHHAVRHAAD